MSEKKVSEKKVAPVVVKKQSSFDDIRSEFCFKNGEIYLNNASLAPLPMSVKKAMSEHLEAMYNEVARIEKETPAIIARVRECVAQYIHSEADNIAFVGSTSAAMNLLALRLKRLDKARNDVVTLQDEFPSSTIPFKRLGYKLNFVRPENDNHYDIAQILRKVDKEKTAAVVVSLVQYRTGARLDEVAALAEELKVQGVPLFVNATQAAGLLPIDVSKIGASALTFASHKWLMAGPGGTVLYVAPGMRGEGFPPLAGWLSARNPEEYNNHHFFPAKEARAVELGVTSILPLIALEAAIKFLGRFNAQIVRDRVLDLSEQLISGLLAKDARVITPIERAKHAGIVSVLRSDAEEFVEKMEKKGIYIAARSPEKKDKDITVRISPHFYNSADEINTLLDNW